MKINEIAYLIKYLGTNTNSLIQQILKVLQIPTNSS